VLRVAGSPKISLLNPYPLPFDRREHRVSLVRQTTGPDNPHGLGDDSADALADAERGDRKSDEHDC
jgi:hypothetical protein